MSPPKVFGNFDPDRNYVDRRATYAVILSDLDDIAAVKGDGGYFLPGGGLRNDETEQQGLTREIREELARDLQIVCEIGRTTQYFYADADNCNYKMDAVFFSRR
jgi:8-oxo-dGTP diphosphatase